MNLVRERADQHPLPSGLTQDEMRQRIRRERRVELAFEEHRAWDVRRWKIAFDNFARSAEFLLKILSKS